jgi:phosphoglycolate phosphatase-like HAD superfamily hydrolase
MASESSIRGDGITAIADASCIVFDFDGTLAPNLDLPDLRRRVVELTRARGVPEDVLEGLYIVEMVTAATRWLADRNPEIAQSYQCEGRDLITNFEIDAAQRTEPFPEIRQALRRLRVANKRLGVVTRNCALAVRTVFTDIDQFCDSVLARDDVTHLKPDARHVRQALDAMEQSPTSALMVGDAALDMRVGRSLNMFCVGVLTGSGSAAQLTEAGAQLVLPRASDLLEFL